MRLLFQDFILFFRKDFHPAAYAYTVVVVALCILLAYTTDFGYRLSYNLTPTSSEPLNNMLLFVVMYFLIVIPVTIIRGEFRNIAKPALFSKALLLMCLLGFSSAFSCDDVFNLEKFSSTEQLFMLKALWWINNLIFVLPVLVLLRLTVDRNIKGLYGVCRGTHHVKAYLSLYIVILPILVAVSFTSDFQSYYPMYEPWYFKTVFNLPVWLNTVLFETVYIGDFLLVEMFFRGALVIGMASILGRTAVLPMIVVYVALHFGKPVMETISALFGGYFLGALAFQTRHIWGGVIIHMGIALLIELLRFFQHYVLAM